jgi:hypothetical protein
MMRNFGFKAGVPPLAFKKVRDQLRGGEREADAIWRLVRKVAVRAFILGEAAIYGYGCEENCEHGKQERMAIN